MKFWNRVGQVYSQVADAGSGGGDAGGAAAPAGGTGASSTGAPATGTTAGGATTAVQPQAQPSGFSYKEDRSTWVPPHRIREQTATLRKLESDLAQERQRVAALSGVTPPPTGQAAEAAAIREQLLAVMPELKEMFDRKDKLFKAADFDFDSLRSNQDRTWEQRGTQALGLLTDQITEAYGGQALSPKAVQHFQGMFISALARDAEMRQRYEFGNPADVVAEFVKDITEGVIAPIKRSAAAASGTDPRLAAAARLPRGGRGGPITASQPRTVKPADGDAFHKAAFGRMFEQ